MTRQRSHRRSQLHPEEVLARHQKQISLSYFFGAGGTFFPDFRASDNPIAIACFRLVTFFPLRPLFNWPFFIAFISLSTSLPEEGEYLRVLLLFLAAVFFAGAFLAAVFFAEVFFAEVFFEADFFEAAFFVTMVSSSTS
jgi:hypothetical protein